MKLFLAILFAAVLALGAAVMIFSPLRVFNALVPVDRGIARVADGVAYGPDERQRLDIYRPNGTGTGLPVLIFCYGGAWNSGDRASYDFAGRAFAKLGYLTIVFDYRLVPETLFPGFVEDTASTIAWAAANAARYGGDGSRVFLVGHSAGAYNVALAALDPRYLAAHGLKQNVVAGVATLSGPFDFLPLDDPSTIDAFGHWNDLGMTQPVNYAGKEAPPFLLMTGDGDTTVYPRNSRQLAARLQKEGAVAKLIEYEAISHAEILLALSRPLRWRAPVLEDIRRFFDSLQTVANRSSIAS